MYINSNIWNHGSRVFSRQSLDTVHKDVSWVYCYKLSKIRSLGPGPPIFHGLEWICRVKYAGRPCGTFSYWCWSLWFTIHLPNKNWLQIIGCGFHPLSDDIDLAIFRLENYFPWTAYGSVSKPWHLVNTKIAGKWMFIPLKMVSIGIDPYPYRKCVFLGGRAMPTGHSETSSQLLSSPKSQALAGAVRRWGARRRAPVGSACHNLGTRWAT
jgi:hypothetical protein